MASVRVTLENEQGDLLAKFTLYPLPEDEDNFTGDNQSQQFAEHICNLLFCNYYLYDKNNTVEEK